MMGRRQILTSIRLRPYRLSRSAARGLAVLCVAILVASRAQAAGVVGTGTPDSCTDAALDTALAVGGLVTFDCGGPATIDVSTGTGTKMITADTTIDGGGLITISGGNSVQVFNVPIIDTGTGAGANFTVKNLIIANGRSSGGRGGGIYNGGAGTLTVTSSTFTGNDAAGGGAIFSGSLTVDNSTFTGNSARGIDNEFSGFNGLGGAIQVEAPATISNSTFVGNTVDTGGTTVDGTLGGGGAIASSIGRLTVTNSTFTGNSAPESDGGGIFNTGILTVDNSTFTGNSARGIDNGLYGGRGGGISSVYESTPNGGTLTVTNSTFSGNSAAQGGGGIHIHGALSVTNSTFTDNSATDQGGGGIWNDGGSLSITNGTFTGNSGGYAAGGIWNTEFTERGYPGTVLLRNTIVANSPSGDNCSGGIIDGGHNLDSGTSCGFGMAKGSLSTTNPQLEPGGLADNGGLSQTIALLPNSPAIGAGDPEVCANAPVNGLDQRGLQRPGAGHAQCSIGAYEADASPVSSCVGDCNADSGVAVNELVLGVDIALGVQPLGTCPAFMNPDARVDIAQLIKGVNNALSGCGAS